MTYLVHAIGHMKMNAKDMNGVVRDMTDILGLHVTYSREDEVWLSSNGRAAEIVVLQSDEDSCHTIGLEVLTADAVREAESRVAGAGCQVLSDKPSLGCFDAGVTFATPQGLRFEMHTPARDDMYKPRYPTQGIGPRRLDHANLISPDPAATRTQLSVIGGMKLSERLVNDSLSWMFGGNRQHHILGVVKSSAPGLHHYSFEISEFAMYCKLGDILDRYNRQIMCGPGRHRPGDNTYAYFLGVSGNLIECSGPMALIADDTRFEPRVITNLERPGNVREMNVWGTPAPLEWREHFFPFAEVS